MSTKKQPSMTAKTHTAKTNGFNVDHIVMREWEVLRNSILNLRQLGGISQATCRTMLGFYNSGQLLIENYQPGPRQTVIQQFPLQRAVG